MSREQRLVFGEDAATYDAARPSYPPAAVEHFIGAVGLELAARVVDVGAGTGKLTELFAARGYAVAAVEPDAAMAAVLEAKRLRNVSVDVSDFEQWSGGYGYAAIVSGQAWHWLDQRAAAERAAAALASGGAVGFFWNRPQRSDPEIDEIYARLAPTIATTTVVSNPSQRGAEIRAAEGLAASGRFTAAQFAEFQWSASYPTSEWLRLLSTHSDHRLLDANARGQLFDQVARVIEARGGVLDFGYVTRLVTARRLADA